MTLGRTLETINTSSIRSTMEDRTMKDPPGPRDDNGETTPAKDTAFIPLPGNNGTDSTLEDLKSAHESVKSSIPNESVAAGRKESCDTGGEQLPPSPSAKTI